MLTSITSKEPLGVLHIPHGWLVTWQHAQAAVHSFLVWCPAYLACTLCEPGVGCSLHLSDALPSTAKAFGNASYCPAPAMHSILVPAASYTDADALVSVSFYSTICASLFCMSAWSSLFCMCMCLSVYGHAAFCHVLATSTGSRLCCDQ